jgi:hypothetical protein
MKKEDKIREEVEKTINAFEHVEKLEGNPHLFTRIQSEIESNFTKKKSFNLKGELLRPVILFLILIMNIFTAVFFFNSKSGATSTKQNYFSAISSEYSISGSYYSKLEKMIGK